MIARHIEAGVALWLALLILFVLVLYHLSSR